MTTDLVEKCARAVCSGAGFGPSEIMPNDGPRWRYYVPIVLAVIDALADGVTPEMVRAAIEDRATDDEGMFPPLGDLIDFSGENKTRTVVRSALSAAIRAAKGGAR